MAELATLLLILLLTSQGTVLAVTPTATMSSDTSSPPLLDSSTVDTTNVTIHTTKMSVALSSRGEQDNTTAPDINVTDSTDGSPTVASPNQQSLTNDITASSAHNGEAISIEASLIPSSLATTTSSISPSSDSPAVHIKENNFTDSPANSLLGSQPDNSSSELSNNSTVTQEHISQKTSLPVTTVYLLSQRSSNTEPSSTYQSSPTETVNPFTEAHTATFSPPKASEALASTSHASVGSSSIVPGVLAASEQVTVSIPLHLSTSGIKTSVLSSETYQSLLHKYEVTKTTLIAVSVGSGLLILFLLVTIAVLCCTRRTYKQAKAQSSQAASSFPDGSQLHSWEPCLPRPSIRPSVYREVSIEMRDNLPRRQRSLIEQSRTAGAANHERIQAIDGQVNEAFTSDADVNAPKQPAVTQAGGHKSPPVTFGPVSVVTISATSPRASQPTTSPSPAPLPSETKALTMPRMTTTTTSSAQSETQPFQNASAHLDAFNGDPGRGQPHKKRRELVYF